MASQNGHKQSARVLLFSGADVEISNQVGDLVDAPGEGLKLIASSSFQLSTALNYYDVSNCVRQVA